MYGATPLDRSLDALAAALAEQAIADGVELTGPNGLLMELGRKVVQAALEADMTHHLSHDWHDAVGDSSGNSCNGFRAKTVHTDAGDLELKIPTDQAGTFSPQLVPKHSRRLPGFDANVLDLYAKGMTTGEI